MKTYTITREEISAIHNGMCSVRRLKDLSEDMFKEDSSVNKLIQEVFKYIEPVRKKLMDEADRDWDRNYKHFKSVAESEKLFDTIWSIYEVEDLYTESNVPKNSIVCVGEYTIHITENRWIDLWRAVDSLAKRYEDRFGNHVFIEKFVQDKENPNQYNVWLGS